MPYLELTNERIYYALHRGKDGGTLPLLLIHGAGENHLAWPAELRRVPGVDVYAIDLPGHGQSSGLGCTAIEYYTAWLAALLDALHALESMKTGGEIVDLPYEWGEQFAMNLGSGYRTKSA